MRRAKTSRALALRARIALGGTTGRSDTAVAAELGTTRTTVGKWRNHFLGKGLEALLNEPRPGAPRQNAYDDVERVMVETLESLSRAATLWSACSMAAKCSLSSATVALIWQRFAIKPHRHETFKSSVDPQFVAKVRNIVRLYLPSPPPGGSEP